MKKGFRILCLWYLCLAMILPLYARNNIKYEIYYDTHTEKTYPLKRNIQRIFNELVDGVEEQSYIIMILQNQKRFAYQANLKVRWNGKSLIIIEGDGQGIHIYGKFYKQQLCLEKVKPKSFILGLLQK